MTDVKKKFPEHLTYFIISFELEKKVFIKSFSLIGSYRLIECKGTVQLNFLKLIPYIFLETTCSTVYLTVPLRHVSPLVLRFFFNLIFFNFFVGS